MPRSTIIRASALAGSILAALLVPVGSVHAASSIVDCGQLTGYTAPDPSGPTDGSVQLGTLSPWTILAAATVSANAAAALPGLVNSGPTCLALDLDDSGDVTALDIATTGTISKTVTFDSGSGFYMLADRLIIPDFVTNAYPGLAALVVTSYQAGTTLTIGFTVDGTTGTFSAFDGTASFCGRGSVTSDGDGQVGDAIIPAAVLDPADIARLEGAGTRQTCATVHSFGTVGDQGALDITTDVDIVVAAAGATVTPPPTSTAPEPSTAGGSGQPILVWLGLVFLGSAAMMAVRRRRPSSRD